MILSSGFFFERVSFLFLLPKAAEADTAPKAAFKMKTFGNVDIHNLQNNYQVQVGGGRNPQSCC